eukprot:TRINITY_DN3679_c0_g2_i1.p1 TRINITY_DN3679_c0_g2~~TRINITY_DN3679_c0_g2_i1.p1  ORF type:complete len:220 (-),score=56.35 TRINITY_DN3679_c0_g2_i1:201-860(-)
MRFLVVLLFVAAAVLARNPGAPTMPDGNELPVPIHNDNVLEKPASEPKEMESVETNVEETFQGSTSPEKVTVKVVIRHKVQKICRNVIHVLRKPHRVCANKQDQVCKDVPVRKPVEKYVCDENNYCRKVTTYEVHMEHQCHTINKRVCKNYVEVKRIPVKKCRKVVTNFKCQRRQACRDHRECLHFYLLQTEQGFRYKRCSRWIQYRTCGISFQNCQKQ